MKRFIVLTAFLFSCSSLAEKNTVNIFDSFLTLNNDCEIEVHNSQKQYRYTPKFNANGECRIISHSSTDIPHIKYINGVYILFIENNVTTSSGCSSEYTAVGISKDNKVLTTDLVKRNGSCYQDKEQISFEYFSAKIKNIKN